MIMPDSYDFRRVGESEAELLTAIHEECFPNYWNRDAFTDFFAVKNTFATLVSKEAEPVGMMVYRTAYEQADIITLAVRPFHRKHGLARHMLMQALAHCKELGAEKMLLEVELGNVAAIGLYEQMGFAHIGRRKLYYQQPNGSYTDALVMSRKL